MPWAGQDMSHSKRSKLELPLKTQKQYGNGTFTAHIAIYHLNGNVTYLPRQKSSGFWHKLLNLSDIDIEKTLAKNDIDDLIVGINKRCKRTNYNPLEAAASQGCLEVIELLALVGLKYAHCWKCKQTLNSQADDNQENDKAGIDTLNSDPKNKNECGSNSCESIECESNEDPNSHEPEGFLVTEIQTSKQFFSLGRKRPRDKTDDVLKLEVSKSSAVFPKRAEGPTAERYINKYRMLLHNSTPYDNVDPYAGFLHWFQGEHETKRTALLLCIQNRGDVETAAKILEFFPGLVNLGDIFGMFPIHLAINTSNFELVELLLSYDCYLPWYRQQPAMSRCLPCLNGVFILKLLLDAGFNCNARGGDKASVITWFVRKVRVLRNHNGHPALHTQMIRLLRLYGAHVNEKYLPKKELDSRTLSRIPTFLSACRNSWAQVVSCISPAFVTSAKLLKKIRLEANKMVSFFLYHPCLRTDYGLFRKQSSHNGLQALEDILAISNQPFYKKKDTCFNIRRTIKHMILCFNRVECKLPPELVFVIAEDLISVYQKNFK